MQRDIAREHVRGLGAQRSRAGSWRDSRAAGGAHSTQAPTHAGVHGAGDAGRPGPEHRSACSLSLHRFVLAAEPGAQHL